MNKLPTDFPSLDENEGSTAIIREGPYKNIGIVIVNRDLKNDTAECIDSLLQAGASIDDILVVDNGSKDGSVPFLLERYGESLNQVESRENFGYPYGLNLGIRFFLPLGKQWFLLMNNDVIVAPNFLAEIKKAMESSGNYALLAPMILYYGKPDTIWFMSAMQVPGTLLFTNDHRGCLDNPNYPQFVPTDFAHGCTLAVRRDVIETIGYFDDTSPIYGDDVDFSWRARKEGFKIIAVPGAKIWHKISSTMQRQKPMTRYLRIRNQIWFYKRYARGFQVPLMFGFTLLRSIWFGIKDLFSSQTNLLIPLVFGFLDGWRGKNGRKF